MLEFLKVVVVEGSSESLVESVAFLYVGFYSLIGLLEHLLVEALAEAFACFGYFFLNLLVVLSELVLDKHVCAVAFFAILIIYEWIVECVHVTRCFPSGWVHEDTCINTHDILVEHGHSIPPVFLDVVLEFYAVLSVVIHGAKSVVNLAAREDEAVLFAVCD